MANDRTMIEILKYLNTLKEKREMEIEINNIKMIDLYSAKINSVNKVISIIQQGVKNGQ